MSLPHGVQIVQYDAVNSSSAEDEITSDDQSCSSFIYSSVQRTPPLLPDSDAIHASNSAPAEELEGGDQCDDSDSVASLDLAGAQTQPGCSSSVSKTGLEAPSVPPRGSLNHSSEDEFTPIQAKRPHSPDEDEGRQHSVAKKKAYAPTFNELPPSVAIFLGELRDFFTKPLNLNRQARPLSTSTYEKAQERNFCEYTWII